MNELPLLLNYLPYKLAAYDAKRKLSLYDNGGADGDFFPREAENLPDWIVSEVLASPTKPLVIPLRQIVLEQILIQTYQASTDQEGRILGFWGGDFLI